MSLYSYCVLCKYTIKNLWVVAICAIAYLANKTFGYQITLPYLAYICRCYLNDFICGVAFPAYVNALLQYSNRKPLKSPFIIMGMMCFFGLFWEFAAPLFVPYSVSDPYDILCYIFGGVFYWLLAEIVFRRNIS